MICAICKTRRARRYCPGVRGDICPICCGQEREVTVRCPLDCIFLIEGRKHERHVALRAEDLPNRDIPVTQKMLMDNQSLLTYLAKALGMSALETAGALDRDASEALEALIQTYRTLQSGVIYAHVPENVIAARIYREVDAAIGLFRKEDSKQLGVSKTRDADVLVVLVYLQRLALDSDNGRRYGRAFLGMLRADFGLDQVEEPSGSSLILP